MYFRGVQSHCWNYCWFCWQYQFSMSCRADMKLFNNQTANAMFRERQKLVRKSTLSFALWSLISNHSGSNFYAARRVSEWVSGIYCSGMGGTKNFSWVGDRRAPYQWGVWGILKNTPTKRGLQKYSSSKEGSEDFIQLQKGGAREASP